MPDIDDNERDVVHLALQVTPPYLMHGVPDLSFLPIEIQTP